MRISAWRSDVCSSDLTCEDCCALDEASMTRGRSHGNLRDRSLTDLSRLGTPAHASRCPNQRRNIMSTTEKDGIAGPKQDEDLRRNPGIGQSKGTTAAGEKVEEIEGDNTVEGEDRKSTRLNSRH